MVKYGGSEDRERQCTRLSLQAQTGLDHGPGVQVLQDEIGLSQQDVELRLILMIRHLQRLRVMTSDTNNTAYGEDSTTPLPRKSLALLQYSDLNQLQAFLVQLRTSTIHSTTTDINATLHRQYRVVNKLSYVHWICRSHMNSLHPSFNPEQIQRFVVGQYNYSSQSGELNIFNRSDAPLSTFHRTIIVKAACVSELIIDIQLGMSASEFYSLRNVVMIFRLSSLNIKSLGFIASNSAGRRPVSILMSDTESTSTSRGDPYRLLQSYSNTLWQLLSDHPLQSLSLSDANHLLTQDWTRRPTRPFRFRRICLALYQGQRSCVRPTGYPEHCLHFQDLKSSGTI
ncbi:hypothetical protein BGZ47_009511 [Haplosporangium gracile]|nr:hypothetical protein BGZ47_009511 [Haplosporangium gracile]